MLTRFQEVTLRNSHGVQARILNYGAKLTELWVPDRQGQLDDVVLGYETPAEYVSGNPYFGATIGRYANRIAQARFQLEGKTYRLTPNQGPHSLHGGPRGFHQAMWTLEPDANGRSVRCRYISADGEEGFPGRVEVQITYDLTDTNSLVISYTATSSQATPLNLTHHSFFNLKGRAGGPIDEHALQILADRFLAIDGDLIPTGDILWVAETPFDFRLPVAIGSRIGHDYLQLRLANGYDHCWVINGWKPHHLRAAAQVYEPATGRLMEVLTTEPGLQFYSGNFLDASDRGKEGRSYGFREAFCLEAQHFPDSPNRPLFPSTICQPGERYLQTTVYCFSAR